MDIIIEFLLFCLNCIFWLVVFNVFAELLLRYLKKPELEAEREELKEKVASMLHPIKQEKHGDIYYWFDADTDQFLAQGKDEDDIREHLLKRFKGHVFLINDSKAMVGPELKVVPIENIVLKNGQALDVKSVN